MTIMSDHELRERVTSLEREVEEIKEKLYESESSSSGLEDIKPVSLPEFKLDYSPSTFAEKALVIGRFFETQGGKDNFSIEDLKTGFKKCKWQLPANLSDSVGKAAGRKGWFMEDGKNEEGNKLWMLTETGEEHLRESIHDDQ